jgi:Xaa-Pro aminopeptidase
MVFTPPTNFALFKQRRKQFIEILREHHHDQQHIIMVMADFETDRHIFRQESSFYYLTGITEPAVILCIFPDGKEILYAPQFEIQRSTWTPTAIESLNDAAKVGVDEIRFLGEKTAGYSYNPVFTREKYVHLLNDLTNALQTHETAHVATLRDQHRGSNLWHIDLYNHFVTALPELGQRTIDCSSMIYEMRRIKDDYETDLIYKAVQITAMAHKTAATLIEAGSYEYELLAAVECVFTQVAAATPAFPSIIASGKNTTVIHYTDKTRQLNDGDLVVIDIGAEYGMYSADLTRTYPVGKTFSPRQREIYQKVLDTQLYIESIAKPGMFLKNARYPEKSLHHLAVTFLERQGLAQYFCHGLGHYLGLDVHDVGDLQQPLQPGEIFTLEPGVYIPAENIGIRIEDNYIMADDGMVCLSYELPKSPQDIERMMSVPTQSEASPD